MVSKLKLKKKISFINIYIKPKLLKLPQISTSAQYLKKKHKKKKTKKRNKRHPFTFTMSASRCSAFPFHNALPSLPCLPLLPALRSDSRQINNKASHLKTQRFHNENPPYPQTNKPKLFFSYS